MWDGASDAAPLPNTVMLLWEEGMVSCQQAREQARAVRKDGGFSMEVLQRQHHSLQALYPFQSNGVPYSAFLPTREVGISGGALSLLLEPVGWT